ncbi:VPS9 domain-containing protein 1 [Nephila pilipes]|uniref:VPS9 domain-containing protein 1 n=1 Tax=Nephila pilipes TaxID=299642 RepID=A0A8X6QM19_NEPPI|nr:VPS9 domain-containing protein 1 [Nephila pilipes]
MKGFVYRFHGRLSRGGEKLKKLGIYFQRKLALRSAAEKIIQNLSLKIVDRRNKQKVLLINRISNLPSEYKIIETMFTHRNSDPAKFGFSNKEYIDSEVYKNSISLLYRSANSNSMTEKLQCLVDVAKTICGNFSRNQSGPNRRLGADDLMPLLCYVIVKSRLPQLSSECLAIEQLFDVKYMFGEEGYALSSFLTALKYIEIRKIIGEEQNEDDQS